jgi:hypothetical protein
MTPEQFFSKNLKWITLILALFLIIKLIQGCNHNMSDTITRHENTHIIDSLTNKCDSLEKNVDHLKFELTLEQEKAGQADKRANAVQSVAEKIKANTTINVKGAEEDTPKK